MKIVGFPDYANTVIGNNHTQKKRYAHLRLSRKQSRNKDRRQIDREKLSKLTWKATLRELFIMLIIAACTAGAILSLGQYF